MVVKTGLTVYSFNAIENINWDNQKFRQGTLSDCLFVFTRSVSNYSLFGTDVNGLWIMKWHSHISFSSYFFTCFFTSEIIFLYFCLWQTYGSPFFQFLASAFLVKLSCYTIPGYVLLASTDFITYILFSVQPVTLISSFAFLYFYSSQITAILLRWT